MNVSEPSWEERSACETLTLFISEDIIFNNNVSTDHIFPASDGNVSERLHLCGPGVRKDTSGSDVPPRTKNRLQKSLNGPGAPRVSDTRHFWTLLLHLEWIKKIFSHYFGNFPSSGFLPKHLHSGKKGPRTFRKMRTVDLEIYRRWSHLNFFHKSNWFVIRASFLRGWLVLGQSSCNGNVRQTTARDGWKVWGASKGTGTLLLTGPESRRLQVERSEGLIQEIRFIIPTPCGFKQWKCRRRRRQSSHALIWNMHEFSYVRNVSQSSPPCNHKFTLKEWFFKCWNMRCHTFIASNKLSK